MRNAQAKNSFPMSQADNEPDLNHLYCVTTRLTLVNRADNEPEASKQHGQLVWVLALNVTDTIMTQQGIGLHSVIFRARTLKFWQNVPLMYVDSGFKFHLDQRKLIIAPPKCQSRLA